jgi:heptosyltransferase I
VILAGGPTTFELEFAQRIQAHMTEQADNLVGQDTLKQAAAVLQRADLVLAPDTGPTHIANAVGTPVIGLYAATNPHRSGPHDSLEWCVDRFDQAARKFCGRPGNQMRWGSKIERPGVMALISVEDVVARIDQWVERNRHRRRSD